MNKFPSFPNKTSNKGVLGFIETFGNTAKPQYYQIVTYLGANVILQLMWIVKTFLERATSSLFKAIQDMMSHTSYPSLVIRSFSC